MTQKPARFAQARAAKIAKEEMKLRFARIERDVVGIQQDLLALRLLTEHLPEGSAVPSPASAPDLVQRLSALELNVAGLRRRLDTHNVNVHQIASNR